MAEFDVPGWVSTAGAIGTAIGGTLVAIWSGRRNKSEPVAEAKIGGATIVSDAGVERLIGVVKDLRETFHDDVRHLRETVDDNTRAVEENTRATRDVMPSRTTPADMLALTARLDAIERERQRKP